MGSEKKINERTRMVVKERKEETRKESKVAGCWEGGEPIKNEGRGRGE